MKSCHDCGYMDCPRQGEQTDACSDWTNEVVEDVDEDTAKVKHKSTIRRVYIAGPLTDFPAQYLHNVGCMTSLDCDLRWLGFSPMNPAADLLAGVYNGNPMSNHFTIEQYQCVSMDWLEVSDVVYVWRTTHADGRESAGVRREIERALELGIPVVYSVDDLLKLRGTEPV